MPEPGVAPGLADVARQWAATLADTKGVSLPLEEIEGILLNVARDALTHAEPGRDAALHRFATMYAALPIGIALAGPSGEIVEANDALGLLLGVQPGQLHGRNIADLGSAGRDAVALRLGLEDLKKPGVERHQDRLKLEHADEGPIWADVTLVNLPGDTPSSAYPVLMVKDANEIHLLQERLLHQNVHDSLTGLPNASRFTTHLEAAQGTSAREQIALIYLMLAAHLVRFRGAQELAQPIAGHGVAYRLGGDEFCLLLSGRFPRSDPLLARAHAALAARLHRAGRLHARAGERELQHRGRAPVEARDQRRHGGGRHLDHCDRDCLRSDDLGGHRAARVHAASRPPAEFAVRAGAA